MFWSALRLVGVLFCSIMALAAFDSNVALAAHVGTVEKVEVYAYGTPPRGEKVAKFYSESIVHDEVLETVPNGGLFAKMDDGTQLTLGGGARLMVDSFVYNPQEKKGWASFRLGQGAFHFISGKMPKDNVLIDTPVATIGIRGTELTITVGPKGGTSVNVISGKVMVHSKDNAMSEEVVAGMSVAVSSIGAVSSVQTGISPTGDIVIDGAIRESLIENYTTTSAMSEVQTEAPSNDAVASADTPTGTAITGGRGRGRDKDRNKDKGRGRDKNKDKGNKGSNGGGKDKNKDKGNAGGNGGGKGRTK